MKHNIHKSLRERQGKIYRDFLDWQKNQNLLK